MTRQFLILSILLVFAGCSKGRPGPSLESSSSELLGVVLALGDGVARNTIGARIAALGENPEAWAQVEAYASPHPISRDARLNLPPELRTYQTVLRSCASLAYYSVLVATHRLLERGVDNGIDRAQLDHPTLGGDEAWMAELASEGLAGLFTLGPTALNWLARHPQAIPSNIPERLERAGLVAQEDGRPAAYFYAGDEVTPYGPLRENLIR